MENQSRRTFCSGQARTILFLLAVTLLASYLIAANPGFYNHDEWQRLDAINAHGLWNYIKDYGQLRAGPTFGFPVRPLGFVQQGLSAIFMQDFPVIAHSIDILIHALAVITLWRLLLECSVEPPRAVLAAALFAISPLTVYSTAWVGASFDRWYTLFSMLAAIGYVRCLTKGYSWKSGLLILIACSCAMLSKETSLMTPVMLAGLYLFLRLTGNIRPSLFAAVPGLALAALPVIAFLWIRMPALQASFSAGASGPYAPSSGNLLRNSLAYFAQPFLVGSSDLFSAAAFIPKWRWAIAVAIHLALWVTLFVRHGWKSATFYLFGYFVFLVPVLSIPILAAHYLYASAVVFSIGLVFSLLPPSKILSFKHVSALVAVTGILLLHTVDMERQFYLHGMCERRFLETLDSHLPTGRTAMAQPVVSVLVAPGAPAYVARQATFGRPPYSGETGPKIVIQDDKSSERTDVSLIMNQNCGVSSL